MQIRIQNILLTALVSTLLAGEMLAAPSIAQSSDIELTMVDGGGGKDKDKKKKKEDRIKSKKQNTKPAAVARRSAKEARRSTRAKQKQIASRTRVRLFFHNTFNTKFGKPVNFRKKRQRRRWRKGRI